MSIVYIVDTFSASLFHLLLAFLFYVNIKCTIRLALAMPLKYKITSKNDFSQKKEINKVIWRKKTRSGDDPGKSLQFRFFEASNNSRYSPHKEHNNTVSSEDHGHALQ